MLSTYERSYEKDPEAWETAVEDVINQSLKTEGFNLDNFAFDDKVKGKSISQAYKIILERQKSNPPPPCDNQADDDNGGSGNNEGNQRKPQTTQERIEELVEEASNSDLSEAQAKDSEAKSKAEKQVANEYGCGVGNHRSTVEELLEE